MSALDDMHALAVRLGLAPGALAGKRIVLHGAARGICREVVLGAVALGARVAFADVRARQSAELVRLANAREGSVFFVETDLAVPERVQEFLERARDHLGGVDIFIHNAVEFQIRSLLEMDMADWDLAQNTNVRPAVQAAKFVLPEMLERGSGVLLNLMGPEGMPFAAAMSASKVALRSFIFSLAAELGPDSGVSVLGFAPGLVDTEMVNDVFPRYCERIGVDWNEYVHELKHNPGYPGLMPVEHAAASLLHAVVHGAEHHGLIADSYSPLLGAGIVSVPEAEVGTVRREILKKVDNVSRLKAYIDEVSNLNAQIEAKVDKRTAELTEEQERSRLLVSQLEALTRRLREQNRELTDARSAAESVAEVKSQFLANTSHELRTPMNALLGMVQLLGESELSDEQREILGVMQSSGRMLLQIINDVLDLSKIDSGKFVLEQAPFTFQTTADTLQEMMQGKARDKGLELEVRIAPDLPPTFMGDESRICQVMMNLLANALKFTAAGRVEMYFEKAPEQATTPDETMVLMGVRDTGPGIPPELLKRLFAPFTQGDNTRTKRFEGTGLGLYLCRKLLDEMGGRIDVDSEVGRGSHFFVHLRLPHATVAAEEPQERGMFTFDPELARRHPLKILLVEDNENNQILANFVFRKMGYEIEMAEDGLEALERVGSEHYDLVLMDVHMPRMDGLEATRRILDQHHNGSRPRIIAMTASTSTEDIAEYLAAGMDGCLSKPFTFRQLDEVVRETLPRSGGTS